MSSVRRQNACSAFGPRSSPLYYTKLSRLPRRLVCAGLTSESLCSIVLTSADSEARIQWTVEARPVNGVCVWPLRELPTHAEMICAWRIEETDWSCPGNRKIEYAAQPAPPREGRFRVLDAACLERFVRGQRRLEQVRDTNLVSTATALFMAEMGLYHEALSAVDAYLKGQSRHSNLLLARTVQTLIYRQMLRQIEQEQPGPSVGVALLGWYITWTQNRERYHREMTVAMMKGQCPQPCLHEVSSSM